MAVFVSPWQVFGGAAVFSWDGLPARRLCFGFHLSLQADPSIEESDGLEAHPTLEIITKKRPHSSIAGQRSTGVAVCYGPLGSYSDG
jgi:hypothetical protein